MIVNNSMLNLVKPINATGKSCLHDTVDFNSLPAYVQKNLALGQSWVEGDVAFHRKIVVPTLLVHGLKDKFVSLVEMCEMERVSRFIFSIYLLYIDLYNYISIIKLSIWVSFHCVYSFIFNLACDTMGKCYHVRSLFTFHPTNPFLAFSL